MGSVWADASAVDDSSPDARSGEDAGAQNHVIATATSSRGGVRLDSRLMTRDGCKRSSMASGLDEVLEPIREEATPRCFGLLEPVVGDPSEDGVLDLEEGGVTLRFETQAQV